MLHVITYDIADDKRRTQIAEELENWGQRVQFSVWECDLDAERAALLLNRLQETIKAADKLRIYRLCQACLESSIIIGEGEFASSADFYQI